MTEFYIKSIENPKSRIVFRHKEFAWDVLWRTARRITDNLQRTRLGDPARKPLFQALRLVRSKRFEIDGLPATTRRNFNTISRALGFGRCAHSQIPNKGGALKKTIHLTIDAQVIKDAKKRCIDEGVSLSNLVEGLLLKRLANSSKFVFLENKGTAQ